MQNGDRPRERIYVNEEEKSTHKKNEFSWAVNKWVNEAVWTRANTVNDIYSIECQRRERERERMRDAKRREGKIECIILRFSEHIVSFSAYFSGSSLFWMWSYRIVCVVYVYGKTGKESECVLRIWNMDEKGDKINDSIEHNVHTHTQTHTHTLSSSALCKCCVLLFISPLSLLFHLFATSNTLSQLNAINTENRID